MGEFCVFSSWWQRLVGSHLMRERLLGIFPLPAPVDESDGEERTPEEDVGEGDDEEDPDLAGAVPAQSARQVGDHPRLAIVNHRLQGRHFDVPDKSRTKESRTWRKKTFFSQLKVFVLENNSAKTTQEIT